MSDGKPQRSADEQQRLVEAIRDLIEHKIVFNEYVGFRMGEPSADTVSLEFDMRPELVGHYMHGRLHGGVISTVLDAAGGLAVIWAIAKFHVGDTTEEVMERFRALATIDMRVDFLRPGIGQHFRATSNVVRMGRRIAATESKLTSDSGKIIASANGAYTVS